MNTPGLLLQFVKGQESAASTASSGGGVNLLFSYRDSHSQPHKNRSKQKSRILQRLKVHATKQNDGICTLCLRCKGERQAIQHLQENLPEVGAFLPSFPSDLGRESPWSEQRVIIIPLQMTKKTVHIEEI